MVFTLLSKYALVIVTDLAVNGSGKNIMIPASISLNDISVDGF